MIIYLFVGREKSINALEEAMAKQIDIVLAAQKDAKTNNPNPDESWGFLLGACPTFALLGGSPRCPLLFLGRPLCAHPAGYPLPSVARGAA